MGMKENIELLMKQKEQLENEVKKLQNIIVLENRESTTGIEDLICPLCGKSLYIKKGELLCSDKNCAYDLILEEYAIECIRMYNKKMINLKNIV